MQLWLLKFQTDFLNWFVSKGQQGKAGCPVVFSEKFIGIFSMKVSQSDTENDRNIIIFQFSKILCIYPEFSTDFVDWNSERGQQGKKMVSSRRFEEFIAVF